MSQHQTNDIESQAYDFNRVQSLKLNNFRSYDRLECNFEGSSVVLLGPNGSGKTNILESLSLLSPGRGLRRASYDQFRNFKGPTEWGINAEVLSNSNSSYKISTGISAGRVKGREVKINEKKVLASKALPEIISVSWLTPSMDQIFVESPSSRRKFLDMMCSSLFNNHAGLIKSYEKLMRERNILLQENKLDIGWLDTLENQMSEDGVSIALNRVNLINGLNTKLDNDQNPVWPKAFLKIDGIIEEKLLFNDDKSIKNYLTLINKYKIKSIEDPFGENDWTAWTKFLSKTRKVQIVGDDLFVTNLERLKVGFLNVSANSILIKLNQIGTVTETLEVIKFAQLIGYNTIISHRSGDSEDTFIADLAVGTNSNQIKTGSLARSERVSKYNQLIRIEEKLGKSSRMNKI